MILDTSFLIDVIRDDTNARQKVEEIEDAGVRQVIPAMAVQELYIGVGATEALQRERNRVEAILNSRPIVPTTAEIARKAGLIDGQLRKNGKQIDVGDATIGATGLVLEEPVVTGNPDHFQRIPSLAVETY